MLHVVLPDQLDPAPVLEQLAPSDAVLIAESGPMFRDGVHKRKLVLLTAAGRHLAESLRSRGVQVVQRTLEDGAHDVSIEAHIAAAARDTGARGIRVIRPGSHAELSAVEAVADNLSVTLDLVEDPHFYSTPAEFAAHAAGRKQLVMEYFYRELRKRHDVLMEADGSPAGDAWNFDKENRRTFGREGPGDVPPPRHFPPDGTTRVACAAVEKAFPGNPGSVDGFTLAVTPEDAQEALLDFLDNRLHWFGEFQDAMWLQEPLLYHSMLSPVLNIKLLNPRQAVQGAVARYREGSAPINSVEGFVRQILGWREYIRGVYWHAGPDYVFHNSLNARRPMPPFFWNGNTRMRCAADVMEGVLERGYAHHIQRLMVMGLFALLYGCDPHAVHTWHLNLYVDAYEWVSAPNVIGMSQFADGGRLATKPYAASGKYIQRMGNYCTECAYDPARSAGNNACPFTTLYWDFLATHAQTLSGNRRMAFQLRNLERKSATAMKQIRTHARVIREEAADGVI
jgi:deoxyribodipyrimidine photolyase-related protein